MKITLNQAKSTVKLLKRSNRVGALVGTAGIGKTDLARQIASEGNMLFVPITCSLMQEGDLMLPIPKQTLSKGLDSELIKNTMTLIENAEKLGLSSQKENLVQVLKMELEKYNKNINKEEVSGLDAVIRAIDEDIVKIIKYLDENPEGEALLFLDELNRASVGVQAELMNLILARELKGTKIPDRCYILVAMNPDSSMSEFKDTNYAVNSGDTAIRDRLTYLYLEPSLEDWVEWGLKTDYQGRQKVESVVIDFLQNSHDNETMFNQQEQEDDLTATPRSWKAVSDIYRDFVEFGETENYTPVVLNASIEGTLGKSVGKAFESFIVNYNSFIKISDILTTTDEVSETIIKKFQKSSEISKTTLLKNVIAKVDNDLNRLADNELDENSPYVAYLKFKPVDKITNLISILSERTSDSSKVLFEYTHDKEKVWELAKESEIFKKLAIETKISLM